jgi:hypothetical protein
MKQILILFHNKNFGIEKLRIELKMNYLLQILNVDRISLYQ